MYYGLCDAKTFSNVYDVLVNYWVNEATLDFAFWIYGQNEETLENICYYYWYDLDEVLKEAWIEEEDEEEDEEDENNEE